MNPLAGLTKTDCAAGCSIKTGCVITAGRPRCAHPNKGGVPLELKDDPAVRALYDQALAALGVKTKEAVNG
jgi:hypothetical protein